MEGLISEFTDEKRFVKSCSKIGIETLNELRSSSLYTLISLKGCGKTIRKRMMLNPIFKDIFVNDLNYNSEKDY